MNKNNKNNQELLELKAFTDTITFEGKTSYDCNSRFYNRIRLPSGMAYLFPYFRKYKSKFVIKGFFTIQQTLDYLDTLNAPILILQLFKIPDDENTDLRTINLLETKTFTDAVKYSGVTYLDYRCRIYDMLRLPAGMIDDFPELRKHKIKYSIMCCPSIRQAKEIIGSLQTPPLILRFYKSIDRPSCLHPG